MRLIMGVVDNVIDNRDSSRNRGIDSSRDNMGY